MSGKATFDGINSLIRINLGESEIDVKLDLYSGWKEWVLTGDNAKYLAAFRNSGGDPIGGGLFTGDVYFLINNWRVEISHSCNINGVLYSDNYPSPYIALAGTNIVTNKVSNLVQTVSTSGGSGTYPTAVQIRQEMDTNSTKLLNINSIVSGHTLQLNTIESDVNQIPSAVRTELSPELSHLMMLQNGQGLDSTQATMLLEIYRLYGLDPTRPLIVTANSRTAGDISQNIQTDTVQTTVTRL